MRIYKFYVSAVSKKNVHAMFILAKHKHRKQVEVKKLSLQELLKYCAYILNLGKLIISAFKSQSNFVQRWDSWQYKTGNSKIPHPGAVSTKGREPCKGSFRGPVMPHDALISIFQQIVPPESF